MVREGEGLMTTTYPSMAALICGVLAAGCAAPIAGQTYERLQPIVLASSPCTCPNPARISQRPLVQRANYDSYLSPSVSENLQSVVMASEMVPLPSGPTWRGDAAGPVAPVSAYTVPAPVVTPGQSVQALRPVTGPSVPEGYVLGRGLMGQPKLFKPGQPMRNLLRYLSL
jgi:hypothetical protein